MTRWSNYNTNILLLYNNILQLYGFFINLQKSTYQFNEERYNEL